MKLYEAGPSYSLEEWKGSGGHCLAIVYWRTHFRRPKCKSLWKHVRKNNLRRWRIGEYILRTIVGKTILGESFFSLSFVRNLQPYFDRLSADGVDGTLTFYGRVECVSIFAECVIGGPSWRVARRKNVKFERMWPVDGNNFLRLSYGRNETGHLMSIFAE